MSNKEEKWHRRYMELAETVAKWSDDPKKQVGAVIVRDNRVLSLGYNGFPTGVKSTPERLEKPLKLEYIVHGEMNAILTAAKMGHCLEGSTMYCTFYPCPDCTKSIIQSGIISLVTFLPDETSSWYERSKISSKMLSEAGINLIIITKWQE